MAEWENKLHYGHNSWFVFGGDPTNVIGIQSHLSIRGYVFFFSYGEIWDSDCYKNELPTVGSFVTVGINIVLSRYDLGKS